MKEKISFENCDLILGWSRAAYKAYSEPIPFCLEDGISDAETGLVGFEFKCDMNFERISSFRWNKTGELLPKICHFKIFLKKSAKNKDSAKLNDKNIISLIGERDYDMKTNVKEIDDPFTV